MLNGHGVIDLMVELNASTFATTVEGLDKSTKYYYKAYASNAEGTGFGLEETFVTASNPSILGWAGHKPELSQVGGRVHGLVNTTRLEKVAGFCILNLDGYTA